MENLHWIGYIAAFCTTVAFVPQVMHVIKTKDTSSISLSMYLVFVIGVFFWLIYGVILSSAPMIIANGITFVLAGAVLVLKLKHK